MSTVYTTAGGVRFHADRWCWALATGREDAAWRAGEESWQDGASRWGLYPLRKVSAVAAIAEGRTACRVCVPPALALPATGHTYGHERMTGIGWFGEPETICGRCTERGLYWGDSGNLRPVHVMWPCTSAVVLGLAPRGGTS